MKKFNRNPMMATVAIIFAFGLMGPVVASAASPAAVNLSSASNFVIISKTGITNTGSHTSSISGNIGSSPVTAAAMDNVFCSELTGTIYGVDAAYVGSGDQACFQGNPPSANKTLIDNAVLDMETAYTDAAGRTLPDGTELYSGLIGGKTFAPGLYKWSTDVSFPASAATTTDVTLSGTASDVWIFQIAGNLDVASGGDIANGAKVILTGGALASNVFWQVGGVTGATIGTYATFNGNILTAKQVILQTGAVLHGRALAQTQVTLDANNVSVLTTTGTLHVVKSVVNGLGGTATPGNFLVHVKQSGSEISGSPAAGVSAPGISYSLSAGTYVVSEDVNPRYTQTFSGACNSSGIVTLTLGASKTCTIINTETSTAPAPVVSSGSSSGGSRSGGGGGYVPPAVVATQATTTDVITTTVTTNTTAAPTLPNTGYSPEGKNVPWNVVAPAALLAVVLLAYIIRRKTAV